MFSHKFTRNSHGLQLIKNAENSLEIISNIENGIDPD